MTYDQRGGVHISNRCHDGQIHVRNARIYWGNFQRVGNKDVENSSEDGSTFAIPANTTRDLNFCGQSGAASGTQGQFDLFDGDTKICTIHWNCLPGSMQNDCQIRDRNPAASFIVNVGEWNYPSGACNHTSGDWNNAYGTFNHQSGPYNHTHGACNHASGALNHLSGGDCNHAYGPYNYPSGTFNHMSGAYNHADGAFNHANGTLNHPSGGAFNHPSGGAFNHPSGGAFNHAYGSHNHPFGGQNLTSGACNHSYGALGHVNVEILKIGRSSRL